MKYLLLFIFLLCTNWHILAQSNNEKPTEIHCKHFFKGYPLGTHPANDLIIRDIYALSNNGKTKFADWVAYQLNAAEMFGDLDLEREWRTDPWLGETETLEATPSEKDDYKNVGTKLQMDRGHQAPLAHFKGTKYASQANFLSNITPQKKELNQGPWRILEDKERMLCSKYKMIYVMTGPLYERKMPQLPNADEEHTIPSGYWKIIVVVEGKKEDKINVAAFIFDQDTPRDSPFLAHLVTVDEIEKRSKLDFFWELPKDEETRIEKNKNQTWVEQEFE